MVRIGQNFENYSFTQKMSRQISICWRTLYQFRVTITVARLQTPNLFLVNLSKMHKNPTLVVVGTEMSLILEFLMQGYI